MKKLVLLVSLIGIFLASPANSTTLSEKEGLDLIAQDLSKLKIAAIKLSRLRQIDSPESFVYEDFVRDLESMIEAINNHTTQPSRQLKHIEPLKVEESNYGYVY